MRADNSDHLIAAAQQRAQATRRRAVAALRRIDTAGTPVTFDTIASEARVSRSWLYNQPDLRAEIERLRRRRQRTPDRQRATDASLQQRLHAATAHIRELDAINKHYDTPSPKRSATAELTRTATHRKHDFNINQTAEKAFVMNTIHHTNPQLTDPDMNPAQDDDRERERPNPQGGERPRALPERTTRDKMRVPGDHESRPQPDAAGNAGQTTRKPLCCRPTS